MKQWIAGIIADPRRRAIPIMTHPGIELAGRRVIDAVTDGHVHCEAVRKLSVRYPAAAATVIMDLSVEAEAFGARISFADDEVPSVIGNVVSTPEEIDALQIPSLTAGRLPQYIDANRLAAESIMAGPLFAGCIGPFSLAGRLFDMTEIMMAMYVEPEAIKQLLEKCTRFIVKYAGALKEAGANGLIIAEPAAGLLSDDDCREFSSPWVGRIVEAVQDDCFMVVLHNCGNRGHCTGAMVATGAAGFHFGNVMDMRTALADCPAEALVMGNLDPVSIFRQGSPQEVYQAATNLLVLAEGWPNFVLSSGCDIPPGVPFENIDAFYRALADYNKNK